MISGRAKFFWEWFEKHNYRLLFLEEISEVEKYQYLDETQEQLEIVCPGLSFQILDAPNSDLTQFIVSAEGNIEFFDDVRNLIKVAPSIKRWEFIKFKPPMGVNFIAEYAGLQFIPKKTIFIPLFSVDDPDKIGIRIVYPDYDEEKHDDFLMGTYLMINTILGEEICSLELNYIEVCVTPEDLETFNYAYVDKLETFLKENRIKKN